MRRLPRETRQEVERLTEKNKLTDLPHKILEEAYKVGIDPKEKQHSGTFFHVNHSTIYSKVNDIFKGKLELMDIKEALRKHPWLKEYMWKAVDPNKDEYTKKAAEKYSGGYFMRILPDSQVEFPLQSCLMITEQNLEQRVHNIILAEEGSKAHIVTSCLQHSTVENGFHIGISEIYVKKNATLNFSMIHNWSETTLVRPRSAAMIEENASFISNYVCLRPVKDVQMYPVAYCNGKNSRVSFNSILYGQGKSLLDIGSRAVLTGMASRAEMISRAIVKTGAKTIVRGLIEGNNTDCKGHLECRGLILDDESHMESIPELIARRKGVEITHEAAVGKISEKELIYLMSRKLSRDQATSTIIRGFMDTSIMGLPPHLNSEIERVVEMATE